MRKVVEANPEPANQTQSRRRGDTKKVSPNRRSRADTAATPIDSLTLAVWSPRGSQGRSTIAASLADALTRTIKSSDAVLLVDADGYAPAQHILHGLTDITAGILAASRLIRQERYTTQEHERVSLSLHGYRLLTGITSTERWPELDDYSTELLVHDLTQRSNVCIYDIASDLDAAVVEPSLGIPRNQLALGVLQRANIVLAVAQADPTSVSRLVSELPRVVRLTRGRILIVINRMRTDAIGVSARKQILEVVEGLDLGAALEVIFIPDDPKACDEALQVGQPVTRARTRSAFAKGIRELASRINSTHVHTARAG